jgi:hypothetical protein
MIIGNIEFNEVGSFLIGTDEKGGTITIIAPASEESALNYLGSDVALAAPAFNKFRCKKLNVTSTGDSSSLDLKQFNGLDELTHLTVVADGDFDIYFPASSIASSALKSLKVLDIKGTIPAGFPLFQDLKSLKKLTIEDVSEKRSGWLAACSVVDLTVHKLKGKNAQRLISFINLKRLCLVDGAFTSLAGVEKIRGLQTLHCVRTRNLTDVKNINDSPTLVNVKFESFKKITDWSFLADSPKWRYLSFDQVSTVQFIEQLPKLVFLHVRTIEDENTSYIDCHESLQRAQARREELQRQNKTESIPFFEVLA